MLAVTAVSGRPFSGNQVAFQTPDEAGKALLASIESEDESRFLSIAGSLMAGLLNSGDGERDRFERARLVEAARRRGLRLVSRGSGRLALYVGDIPQAFPAPLVKTGLGWQFDADSGIRELTARRIHSNEVAVGEQCWRFHDAELSFYAQAHDGNYRYATSVRSARGEHDGLFWADPDSEDESPIGPSFAAAFMESQPGELPVPLFGYYFKILTAQGPDAPGGTADYRVDGQLRKGFALVAWPARYGVAGVRSFLISHHGNLYQKDLGPDTPYVAGGMSIYNPDNSWRRVDIYEK